MNPENDAGAIVPTPEQPIDTPEPTPVDAPAPAAPEGEVPLAPSGESAFALPDEFKDKPWATKVSSQEDLYKQIDNLSNLVGRKNVAPDLATATPQEVEEYYNQLRPESADNYAFSAEEGYQKTESDAAIAGMLHKHGISEHQGNNLIEDFNAMMGTNKEALFDPDNFLNMMEAHFGKGYEIQTDRTRQFMESNMNDTQKAQVEAMPNQYLQTMYMLANNVLNAYGASETGKAGNNVAGGAPNVASLQEQQSEVRKQLHALSSNPNHSANDKAKLLGQLTQLKTQEIKQKGSR